MQPTAYSFSANEMKALQKKFNSLSEVTSFSSDAQFASQIASYGILREIGSVNDELAQFIFDARNGSAVRLTSLKAEIIKWDHLFGLRIWSTDTQNLDLRTPGFYEVVHPVLSKNEDGTLHSLYIFPEIINEIAKSQGVELVLVKSWGLNSIFGGFDPTKGYYQTNFWELENNDALKFSDLIRQGKVAFMGTHDLIAHIAGINCMHWPLLKKKANEVYNSITDYFKTALRPSISSLIVPYTIGVVLDDLAQPPSYSSKSHLAFLDELLARLNRNEIPANLSTLLIEFPVSFQNIINLSRTVGFENSPEQVQAAVTALTKDILSKSFSHSTHRKSEVTLV